uniref:Uncharacterized protein n=1 Tax=Anguilla anguilla TaxID=7936 RepID=A0A0E9R2G6_ANGAN
MQEKCNYSFSFTSNLSLGCIYFYLTNDNLGISPKVGELVGKPWCVFVLFF